MVLPSALVFQRSDAAGAALDVQPIRASAQEFANALRGRATSNSATLALPRPVATTVSGRFAEPAPDPFSESNQGLGRGPVVRSGDAFERGADAGGADVDEVLRDRGVEAGQRRGQVLAPEVGAREQAAHQREAGVRSTAGRRRPARRRGRLPAPRRRPGCGSRRRRAGRSARRRGSRARDRTRSAPPARTSAAAAAAPACAGSRAPCPRMRALYLLTELSEMLSR